PGASSPTWASGPRNGSLYTRVSFDRELNSRHRPLHSDSSRCPKTGAVRCHRSSNRHQMIRTTVRPFSWALNPEIYIQSARELAAFGSLIGQLVCQGQRRRRHMVGVTFSLAKPNSMFRNVLPTSWTRTTNSPDFCSPPIAIQLLNVSVHERPGAELAMISADDADFGDNGRLVYSLLGAADTDVIASTTNTVSMPFCDVSLFHLNPSSGLLVLRQSPPILASLQTDGARRGRRAAGFGSTEQPAESDGQVHWTAAQEGEGGEGVSDGQPAGDAGRNRGLDGGGSGSGAHDLVVVTVCVGLSFLVLLCVVLLLAYFCYYLQPPGQAAAEDPQDGAARGVGGSRRATGTDWARGRKKRRGWLAKLGLGGVSSNNGGNFDDLNNPTLSTASDRTMGGRGSSPCRCEPRAGAAEVSCTDESDDEFATAGLQYFANRHSSVKQSGYYQRPRYQQNQMHRRNSEDSDVASAMLPQYAARGCRCLRHRLGNWRQFKNQLLPRRPGPTELDELRGR
uniref:Cadherin domain-containing protein n=1 Tax=Macrostomum lignano TaxID=282301 RepID=A0A1I8F6X0_9PLAT